MRTKDRPYPPPYRIETLFTPIPERIDLDDEVTDEDIVRRAIVEMGAREGQEVLAAFDRILGDLRWYQDQILDLAVPEIETGPVVPGGGE